MQIPSSLRLLDIATHDRVFVSGLDRAPHLEVLCGISVGVLGRSLPGDHVGAERREAQLEHVVRSNCRYGFAGRWVDDSDSISG